MKEKRIILTAGILPALACSVCHAQDVEREQKAAQVKSSVTRMQLKHGPSVAVIWRDLSQASGSMTVTGEEDFIITRKGAPGWAKDVTVRDHSQPY